MIFLAGGLLLTACGRQDGPVTGPAREPAAIGDVPPAGAAAAAPAGLAADEADAEDDVADEEWVDDEEWADDEPWPEEEADAEWNEDDEEPEDFAEDEVFEDEVIEPPPDTPLEPKEFMDAVNAAIADDMDPVEVQDILARVPPDPALLAQLKKILDDEFAGRASRWPWPRNRAGP